MFTQQFYNSMLLKAMHRWVASRRLSWVWSMAVVLGLFVGQVFAEVVQGEAARELGWVSGDNACGGTYQRIAIVPKRGQTSTLVDSSLQFSFEHADLPMDGKITLTEVTVITPDKALQSRLAYLYRAEAAGKLVHIELHDRIRYQHRELFITGERADLVVPSKLITVENLRYRYDLDKVYLKELTAWGNAARFKQLSSQEWHLHDASYSTCAPDDPMWQIKASEIKIDRSRGYGTAKHARLYIKKVPILYSPYLSFPTDRRRKTGFLFPSWGHSDKAGWDFSFPFYLNLAPNYDATITTRQMTERGLQFNGFFRYLTPNSFGRVNLGIVPHDKAFDSFKVNTKTEYAVDERLNRLTRASDIRRLVSLYHQTQFDKHWYGYLNLNYVSDDYYFQDLSAPEQVYMSNQLIRELYFQYAGLHWDFIGRVQGFQTLHPVNQNLVLDQYRRIPELAWRAEYPKVGKWGLNYSFHAEFTNFFHPDDTNVLTHGAFTEGERAHVQPAVEWPWVKPYGHVSPKLSFSLTQYHAANANLGVDTNPRRSLPIFSVDSGLVFQKMTNFLKRSYSHTLEPKLFYLYVPYHDQKNLPVYDSFRPAFTSDQLYSTNRFNGIDRLGDANQVTVGLISRMLSADHSQEKIKVGVGQIYYLRDREVSLCTVPNCIMGEDLNYRDKSSPIVVDGLANFDDKWSLSGEAAWDPYANLARNENIYIQYRKNGDQVINIGYNFVRSTDVVTAVPQGTTLDDLKQVYTSFGWLITYRWQIMGQWNYNIDQGRPQTYFYGLQYDTCCWAVRTVAGRVFTGLLESNGGTTNKFNKAYYLQWKLKSLGSIGNRDPGGLILTGIPGFRSIF